LAPVRYAQCGPVHRSLERFADRVPAGVVCRWPFSWSTLEPSRSYASRVGAGSICRRYECLDWSMAI
jgi:hypothetical protein